MARFDKGTKVRVNEGELEGVEGIVAVSNEHSTIVAFDLHTGAGSLALHTEMLVSADEDIEALVILKNHPELRTEKYLWRLTTWVDGLMFKSLPIDYRMLMRVMQRPLAGLYALEYIEKGTASKANWKTLWQEP